MQRETVQSEQKGSNRVGLESLIYLVFSHRANENAAGTSNTPNISLSSTNRFQTPEVRAGPQINNTCDMCTDAHFYDLYNFTFELKIFVGHVLLPESASFMQELKR